MRKNARTDAGFKGERLVLSPSVPYFVCELFALILAKVPVPVMTLGIDANRFVVLDRIKKLAFGALRGPFLLADGTMHGKSDEDFGHGALLQTIWSAYSVRINDGGSSSRCTAPIIICSAERTDLILCGLEA